MRLVGSAVVAALAAWALGGTVARAQDDVRASVGDGAWAMPAIHRVGVPAQEATGVDFAAYGGYGFTEGVLSEGDTHHRIGGSLAGSFRPTNWLSAGLRFDGRYDTHSGTGGSDSGWVGDPRLQIRTSYDATEELHLGFELGGWFPGSQAPSVQWNAVTVDFNGMLAWLPTSSPLVLALNVGFRLDNSSNSAAQAQDFSRADRLALGVSDFNSVRTGLGVSYRVGRIELLGEYTWEMLVGTGAPPVASSPMRFGAGVRLPLDDNRAWWLHGMIDAALSSREPFVDGAKLYPIEPRVGVSVGITYRLGGDPPRPVVETHETDHQVEPTETALCVVGTSQPCTCTDGASGTQSCTEGPAPEGETGTVLSWGACTCATGITPAVVTEVAVSGHVRADNGTPIGDAHVTIVAGTQTLEATTSADGAYAIAAVPVGSAELRVAADGFQNGTLPLTLGTEAMSGADVTLERAVPGAMVRGRVRSFNGQPLAATIRIESLSREVTANADGQFELEVPPGAYQVSVTAAGHEAQTRRVTVEEQGVVFLNVDMRRSR